MTFQRRTFDDEDVRADVSLPDDDALLGVVNRVHRVDDLLDLRVVQVLHEVVAEDRLRQQLLRPACATPPVRRRRDEQH